jgi:hypothetical protein
MFVDVAPNPMEEFEQLLPWKCTPLFLTTLCQAPEVFTVRVMLGGPRPHDLHGVMVPHDFLSPDPCHWGLAKGNAMFRVWCAQKLGSNGYRNLDRDA